MKLNFYKSISLTILFVFLCSCSEQNKLEREVKYREEKISQVANSPRDSKKENLLLLETYEDYINQFPNSQKSLEYGIRSAKIWVKLGKPNKAVKTINKLAQAFPNHPRTAEALLFKAFIATEKLKQMKTAEDTYKEIILRFPKTQAAAQANTLLQTP